jgi:hypothetical protein
VFVCWLLTFIRPNKLLFWVGGSIIGWLVLYGVVDKADILLQRNSQIYLTGADVVVHQTIAADDRQALMWEQSGVWRYFGLDLITKSQLIVTDTPADGPVWLEKWPRCFYSSVFRSGVWPPDFAQDNVVKLVGQTGETEIVVADDQKVWYRICSQP